MLIKFTWKVHELFELIVTCIFIMNMVILIHKLVQIKGMEFTYFITNAFYFKKVSSY